MPGRVLRLTLVLIAFPAGLIAAFVLGPKSRETSNPCPDPAASECVVAIGPTPTWILASNGLIAFGPGLIAFMFWRRGRRPA